MPILLKIVKQGHKKNVSDPHCFPRPTQGMSTRYSRTNPLEPGGNGFSDETVLQYN